MVQFQAASTPSSTVWMELTVRILQAVGQYAVRWKDGEHERFQKDLAASAEFLRNAKGDTPLRTVGDAITKGIRDYSEQAQRCIEGAHAEMKEMIGTLTSSMAEAQRGAGHSMEAMDQIGQTIQANNSVEQLETVKIHLMQTLNALEQQEAAKVQLMQTLNALKASTAERKQASTALLNNLQERVFVLEHWGDPDLLWVRSGEPVTAKPAVRAFLPAKNTMPAKAVTVGEGQTFQLNRELLRADPATGLPPQVAAEAAILELMATPDHQTVHVGVYFVQRMQWTNARYGEKFGNAVLSFCAQYLARGLQPEDQLFRWRGPCFVALLRRGGSPVDVRQETQRMCAAKLTFESPNAAMLLPVSIAALVIETGGVSSAEIISAIDEFMLNGAAVGQA